MPTYAYPIRPLGIFLAILVYMVMSCPDGLAGDLEAAPWKHVVGVNEQELLGKAVGDTFFAFTPEILEALPKLAGEGNPLAAAMLGAISLHEDGDMEQSMRWLRMAVENGDVDSAFVLGERYFPISRGLGLADCEFKPNIVLGYAWFAIAMSGIAALEEKGEKARIDRHRAEELITRLRKLLLSSERARIAEIVSAWPETPPPDTPLEPMRTEPHDADQHEEDFPDAPPDADAIVELVRRWTTGEAEKIDRLGVFSQAPPEFAPVLRDAYAKMLALAESGDKEAEYMAAWCRLYGLGTAADAGAVLPLITEKAEMGDAEAMFLISVWSLKHDDAERAIAFATRAAEKGHGRSLLLLSGIWRDRGDREKAARWMEAAAEVGEPAAIEEMLSIAESSRDWQKIIQWLTVTMIRTSDPAVAHRCRMLIAYVGSDAGEEALREAMEAGERWHEEHPAPALPPAG